MPEREPKPDRANPEKRSYQVDTATDKDIAKLNAVFPPPDDDPQQHEYSLSLQEKGEGAFYVVRESDDVAGYMTLIHDHQHPRHPDIRGSFITGLKIGDEHKRQGLASQLVERCEQAVKNRDDDAIYLIVEATNQPARQLYTKLGYKELPDKSFVLPKDVDPDAVPQLCYRKRLL